MSIDYATPRFTFREAAAAAGFEHNTLRSYFQRGAFRILGQRGAKGVPSLLNLLDVMTLAVAARLRRAGVDPEAAFEAGVRFAHLADGHRLPAQLYNPREGFTVLIYRVESREAEVVKTGDGDGLGFTELFFDRRTGGRSTSIIVLLNDVERDVFSALGSALWRPAIRRAAVDGEPEGRKGAQATPREKVEA